MNGGGDSQPSFPPQSHNTISTRTSVIITCVITGVIIMLIVLWFAKCYYFKRVMATRGATTGSVLSSPSSPMSESNSNLANGREVLSSIPIFVYTLSTGEGRLDCSVCLGEFEDRERGRTLPTCLHSFHADCIETWFRSHTTCPICRSDVAPEPELEPGDPQV